MPSRVVVAMRAWWIWRKASVARRETGPRSRRRRLGPLVGVDVDVVDGPASAEVLGVEHELGAHRLAALPERQSRREREGGRRRPGAVARAAEGSHGRLIDPTAGLLPAQLHGE